MIDLAAIHDSAVCWCEMCAWAGSAETAKGNSVAMVKRIFKYELTITDTQTIQLPEGAQVLTVQAQRGIPCLWALVDPERPKQGRIFEVFGTGHPVHVDMAVERAYIGTFQLHDGDLVFHVFERSHRGAETGGEANDH